MRHAFKVALLFIRRCIHFLNRSVRGRGNTKKSRRVALSVRISCATKIINSNNLKDKNNGSISKIFGNKDRSRR
jgi:hypothetical protein